MRRALTHSGIAVAVPWVATVVIRLLLPMGDHLAEMADEWLYWTSVMATIIFFLLVTFTVTRHRHLMIKLLCWAMQLFCVVGFLLMAGIAASPLLFDALDLSPAYPIDEHYLVREDVGGDIVLYRRGGLVEHKMCNLQTGQNLHQLQKNNPKIRVCERHNLVLVEYDETGEPWNDSAQVHRRMAQTLEGECYTDEEVPDILTKCPETR